jgi:hypothetical protein
MKQFLMAVAAALLIASCGDSPSKRAKLQRTTQAWRMKSLKTQTIHVYRLVKGFQKGDTINHAKLGRTVLLDTVTNMTR